ncbi:heavy metal translocating P-type ATPase (plasmid) [Qingshengfaniella alkalisoli]|uniref:Heavy metal translocating P-type ATPase n=1 Tax=Qingshengfaniella alkalisoli TaxID=2599296 RepID=A0A5B8IAW7_9RHOB|nr:heavy metal translocating P-type ATPase [Qingshengfaniella alkalisoli]
MVLGQSPVRVVLLYRGEIVDLPSEADAHILLSVPAIHCAACISRVERALNAQSGVKSARVNLTLKRAIIDAEGSVYADDMIRVLNDAGYDAYELDATTLKGADADRSGRDLLMRLGVAGFAAMNVMLLSVAVWSGAVDSTRDMFHWISAAITLPAIAFSAQPFFVSAWSALRRQHMNMDVPIALAILLALGTSLYETAHSGEHAYFDAALTLTFFLLAGRYLDHRTRSAAKSAAAELAALELPNAMRVDADGDHVVRVIELRPGDLIRVLPGARLPADGVVAEGETEVDRSLLTGETTPVFAGLDVALSAGDINLTGPIVVRVSAAGKDSSLHALADLVAVAESGRANYSSLADRAARLYAPGVHILAALSCLGWYLGTGDMRVALNIAAAVLIITCPCALGLAVPAVTTAASGRLFRNGLLIKDGTALERLAEIDTVVFDKTGTLTLGVPKPELPAGVSPDDLAIALALSTGSAHPMSKGLVKMLHAEGIQPAKLTDICEHPGYGVEAVWRGLVVRLGRGEWVGAVDAPQSLSTSWLRIGDAAPVPFVSIDNPRPGAAELIQQLRACGLRTMLLSGDGVGPVGKLAQSLGIDDHRAGMLPQDKAASVQALTKDGHKVLMIGDGLNDTAALAAAHVSISPASALDAARVASDIVLIGNDISVVFDARNVALTATKRIHENFRIATLYNILAVPLAIAGLATPLMAALAMSTSSVTVSLNALRLGQWRNDA